MRKYKTNYYVVFVTLLLILVNIFRDKNIYLAPSINTSISTLIYPLTFLLVVIIYKRYNLKEAKESIIMSGLLVILFYLIISILCTISSTPDTMGTSGLLRKVFTPNSFEIYNMLIYYPDLLALFSSTIIYLFTHIVCVTLYDIIEENSNYFTAFLLSLLISFILDQILFVPIINIPNMLYNNYDLINIIKILTGDFIIVVISSLILILIYPLCLPKKERKLK